MSIPLSTRLERRRAAVLQKVATAAEHSDTGLIHAGSEQLRVIDELLTEYARLDVRVEALLEQDLISSDPGTSAVSSRQGKRVAGRGHGIAIRSEFLERAHQRGITLKPWRGSIFRSLRGARIGVAVATERRQDRWFLGLPQDSFDSAVLLCRATSGKTVEICLPPPFIARHGPQLSRSAGQVKFNVARRGRHFTLLVPKTGAVDIDQYVGALTGIAPIDANSSAT